MAYQYVLTIGGGDDNRRTLVLDAGLRQPCCLKASVIVSCHLDCALHGHPVGVDIEQAHEDADHHAAVVEVFVLFDFLHHYDFAVGRCYDDIRRILGFETSYGAAEEIDEHQIQGRGYAYGDDGD